MTDPVTREEFEALEARVAELEGDGAPPTDPETPTGLDHRDQTVLDYMAEHEKSKKLALVKLYKRLTDVTSTSTAKERARTLEQHPAYEEL